MRTAPIQKSPSQWVRRYLIPAPIFAAMLFSLSSFPVRADVINFLSATRYVTASGLAGDTNGSTTYSDTRTATQFNAFHDSASGLVDWPSPINPAFRSHAESSATQDSSFGAADFALFQQISFATFTPLPGGGAVHAIAESLFQVTFTVSQAVNFELTIQRIGFLRDPYLETFSLRSMNSNVNFNPALGTFSGLLFPGETYVFIASQRFDNAVSDPLGQDGFTDTTLHMRFFSVPESGGFLCLLLGVFAVLFIKRETVKNLATR